MQKIFICSPYRGDVEGNTKIAREAGRFVAHCGGVPIIPHLVFPQFLNDNDPDERLLGIRLGADLLKLCDEMWVIGGRISKGMKYEIGIAKELNTPIRCYDAKMNHIRPDTIALDDRVDETFLAELRGANLQ